MIHDFITEAVIGLDMSSYKKVGPNAYAHKSCVISPSATIIGPAIIEEGTEVRPGAYIRGDVYIGKGCVIGCGTEIKNSLLFDGVKAPHHNYIGDSVLGFEAHLGAGAILSNLKLDHSEITVKNKEIICKTGLKKFGAIIGDHVEIGCQTVLNPGTIVGKESRIYPSIAIKGVIPPRSIVKSPAEIVPLSIRD